MNLIRQPHARYLNDHAFLRLLGEHDIGVLSDFVSEDRVINDFWDTYYGAGVPRVVLCGLNPGRFGAGQTGIPFMDFASRVRTTSARRAFSSRSYRRLE